MATHDLDIPDVRRWLEHHDIKIAYYAKYTDDEVAAKLLEIVVKIYDDLVEKGLIQPLEPVDDYCPPELRRPYVEPEALIRQTEPETLYRRNRNGAEQF